MLLVIGLAIGMFTMSACDKTGQEVGVIKTDFGEIVVKFLPDAAPKHVENFKKLANEKYYDGTTFHRVVPGFMIQGGDPNSKDADRSNDGTGGPGYTIPAEIRALHVRGSLAAARTDNPLKRSSGSQFYICVVNTPFLDGAYTVYGEVISGLDVMDKIVAVPRDARDNPVSPVRMTVTIENRDVE
jgi:cyclophilin family peptidyl-prolyl cis-trans isomerase